MQEGSYMLIERGMTVRGRDADLGTVEQVIVDTDADVFRGLVLVQGLLLTRRSFLSAEHVVAVSGNVVQVDISKADAENLPPPSAVSPASS